MKKIRNTTLSRRDVMKGAAAIGISLNFPSTVFASGQLNFYNWDTYIGETTLDDFKGATGVEVQYDLYADNDELFAKLKNGNPGYDLIVPSNDYVERMIAADMLVPLDKAQIPNISNIEDIFLDAAFDPGRKFSLPYMWGTIGVGYRKSKLPDGVDSWKLLLDDDTFANKIALMGDGTTVLQTALKYLGHSLNDWSDANLKAAEELITKQKKNITAFAPDNGQDLLMAGEVDLAMEWNGDIIQAMEEDDDIGFSMPKEGGMRWEDTLCIPKGAKNIENAHKMINYILDGEAGAKIADYIQYATPNKAAKAKMGDEYLNNPAIFPPEDVLALTEVSKFPGQDNVARIDAAWTRIKAAG